MAQALKRSVINSKPLCPSMLQVDKLKIPSIKNPFSSPGFTMSAMETYKPGPAVQLLGPLKLVYNLELLSLHVVFKREEYILA